MNSSNALAQVDAPPLWSVPRIAGRRHIRERPAELVGRQADVSSILAALASRGNVVITGPSGIGKSALVEQVTSVLDRPVIWNRAGRPSGAVPAGPITPMLVRAGVDLDPPLLALASVGDALWAAAPDAVVVVDDAHLLDDVSAAAVHRVALAGGSVMLTVRSGVSRPHAIDGVARDPSTTHVDLGPLGPETVGDQLTELLGGRVHWETAARIHELSGGVPLYIDDIALAGAECGWLRQSERGWRAGDRTVPASPRLRALVERCLRDCSPEAAEALEVVAVAGMLELGALVTMVGADVLLELERHALVQVVEMASGPAVTARPPIVGQVLSQMRAGARQRLLADELVDALLGMGEPTVERWHRVGDLTSRSTSPRPDLLLRAARAADAANDLSSATGFARAAARFGGGLECELAWAEVAVAAGDFEGARRAIRMVDSRPDLTDRARRRRIVVAARLAVLERGDPVEAERLLRSLDAIDPEDRALRDLELASLLADIGRSTESIAVGSPLLASSNGTVRARVAAVLARAHAMTGSVEEVADLVSVHMADAIAHAEAAPRAAQDLILAKVVALWSAGALREMEEAATTMLASAEATEDAELLGTAHLLVGLSAHARGHVAVAAPSVDRALQYLAEHGASQLTGWANAVRAHLAAVAGDAAAVHHHLAASEAPPFHSVLGCDLDRAMARARLLSCAGDRSAAVNVALHEADRMRTAGRGIAEATLLDLASRLGERSVVSRLRELARSGQGQRIGLMFAHAAAAADADADGLLDVVAELEAIGDDFAAADAAAEAARSARDEGRQAVAAAAASRARGLLDRCGIATPTRPLDTEGLSPRLTVRELDIARLAARGWTNRRIADTLVVSPRTVGNHLYRIYAKLGVGGREDLPSVLPEAGHCPIERLRATAIGGRRGGVSSSEPCDCSSDYGPVHGSTATPPPVAH